MNTEAKYLEDTYSFRSDATITDMAQIGNSAEVYFDQTIFYPEGGGQPSDTGFIEVDDVRYDVTAVEYRDGNIVHHIIGLKADDSLIGKSVVQHVDGEKRVKNAKTHTAGHLITHILEDMNPDLLPAKGYHFPSGSFVEMLDEKRQGNSEMLDEAMAKLQESIDAELEVRAASATFEDIEKIRPFLARYVPKDKPTRMLTIGHFTPVPCGGTHVSNTKELSGLVITRIKRKKDRLKVNYELN